MTRSKLLPVHIALVLLVFSQVGCISVHETRVQRPGAKSCTTGKLTISVDPESVRELGPVGIRIDGRYYGHLVKDTEFAVAPGNRIIMLERPGFKRYTAIVYISPEQPVLIVPSFEKE